jgi:hypothetical protein
MKKLFFALLAGLLGSSCAFSQTIYDGYPAYYGTINGIFKDKASFRFGGGQNAVVYWQGRRVELRHAKAFPREQTLNDDLGTRALAYEKFPYACVEGQPSSGSGTADRYRSVYLMDTRVAGKVAVYKLPSLFASCAAVRVDEQMRPLFYDADYIYIGGSDSPVGLTLREYVISQGKFVLTGHSVTTRFVEPDNVWKFEVTDVR